MHPSTHLSTCLHPSLHLSIHLHPSKHLSFKHASVYLSIHPSIHLPLPIYPSTSIHPNIHHSNSHSSIHPLIHRNNIRHSNKHQSISNPSLPPARPGTHGHMKCTFNGMLKSEDTILLILYKRVFPKWSYNPLVTLEPPSLEGLRQSDEDDDVDDKDDRVDDENMEDDDERGNAYQMFD